MSRRTTKFTFEFTADLPHGTLPLICDSVSEVVKLILLQHDVRPHPGGRIMIEQPGGDEHRGLKETRFGG